MTEPTLKTINRLSLWDISHYWHGFNPLKTSPSRLPIEVQKSIRALALKASKNLQLRCTTKGLIYKSLTDPDNELPLSYVRRAYRREFKYAIEGRKYKKSFLTNINMSRSGVLIWCKENNFKPPAFWFADDDPILKKSVEELDKKLTPEEIEKYGMVTLFSEEPRPIGSPPNNPIDTAMSQQKPESHPQDSLIQAALSRMNKANAKVRYEPADKLKAEFKEFFKSKGYRVKSHAARDFFESLDPASRRFIVPSYFETEHDQFIDNAVRNLREVLKE